MVRTSRNDTVDSMVDKAMAIAIRGKLQASYALEAKVPGELMSILDEMLPEPQAGPGTCR